MTKTKQIMEEEIERLITVEDVGIYEEHCYGGDCTYTLQDEKTKKVLRQSIIRILEAAMEEVQDSIQRDIPMITPGKSPADAYKIGQLRLDLRVNKGIQSLLNSVKE